LAFPLSLIIRTNGHAKALFRAAISGGSIPHALKGYNEQVVRQYIRNQEKADKASDFADLFNRSY